MNISKTLFTILISIILSHSIFYATTINVPDEYNTIQEALNNAASGDTVLVQTGTYYENIYWPETNSIKLISVDGSSNTIIDGGGNSCVIYINPQTTGIDATTSIQGFKIMNGGNINTGGGLFIFNASPTIKNFVVENCTSTFFGGGIYLEESNSIITDGKIHECSTYEQYQYDYGGGIYSKNCNLTISNLEVFNCDAQFAGGIGAINSSIRMSNLTVKNNTASYSGGGIGFFSAGSLFTSMCNIYDNHADRGGGIYSFGENVGIHIFSDETDIYQNTANVGGGFSGTSTNINGGYYYSNRANNYGGGFEITDGDTSTIRGCYIINNIANGMGGGAFFLDGTSPKIIENKIISNHSTNGGGIYFYGGSKSIVTDNHFIMNSASQTGGAAYIGEYNPSPNISRNSIIDNESPNVGGIAMITSIDSAIAHNNFISNNKAVWSNDPSSIVNAKENWWGNSSGPYHPSQNTAGLGDTTNNFVNVTPWQTELETLAPPIPVKNVILTDSGANFATLSWEASPIGDLAGYKIYYDTDEEDFPYRFSVDVGNVTSKKLDSFVNKGRYFFAVVAYDIDGNESWFTKADQSVYLDTEDIKSSPATSILNQNHPNPFNPSTTISYSLPEESKVTISIYNLLGKQITQLTSSTQHSGTRTIQWNGTDQQGNLVPAGIYFYQLQAGDFSQTKKMVLMK
ncbi:right-handed parallel beta-helix repeat-containing protein [Candidatus Neomarinimicrobiota bacterium]